MFPDSRNPETEALRWRNSSDTGVMHLADIERLAGIVPAAAARKGDEMMFGNLSRFGVTIRQAHARNKAIRALNDLPAHVQKDIGWPASPPSDPQAALHKLLLGTPR